MQDAPVSQGDVIGGRYRIENLLGEGGMGVVVAATHVELLEPRAVKFMRPSASESPDAVMRFLREARAAARLKGEHIAKVYDAGRLESGAPYMVMEYLEGSDLRSLLKQRTTLPVDEAALYVLQACEALAEAHSNGIVHRDLKPGNLFLTRRPDGSPCIKVLDFGISKVLGPSQLEIQTTRSNVVLGTPSYMSPEQMKSPKSVDYRSDVWSLGVILYRMVTGNVPFPADNLPELISSMLTEPAPPSRQRPSLPPEIDRIVLRCLQRRAEDRFQTVAELAAALVPLAAKGAEHSVERIERLLASPPASGRAALPSPLPPRPFVEAADEIETRPEIAAPPRAKVLRLDSCTSTLRSPTPERAPLAIVAFGVVGAFALGLAGAAALWYHPAPPAAAPASQPAQTAPADPSPAPQPAQAPSASPSPPSAPSEAATPVRGPTRASSAPKESKATRAASDPFGRSRK
ncbi:serine/threonine-protein kinase [Polyangium aurulentum]|uniref:serine/threonine-protein kinase n=1 Tax=Polyangium aurulentum TaxID=2567896 RepID=UPI0010AEAB14|nr:serine/threonine-protein kinase [Polyangium aurulentum]UQA57221.1 serine/threonine protein kinase [Polyangium aurulentum]